MGQLLNYNRTFTFTLELCIDYTKVSDYFKTGELDLDLRAQIGH